MSLIKEHFKFLTSLVDRYEQNKISLPTEGNYLSRIKNTTVVISKCLLKIKKDANLRSDQKFQMDLVPNGDAILKTLEMNNCLAILTPYVVEGHNFSSKMVNSHFEPLFRERGQDAYTDKEIMNMCSLDYWGMLALKKLFNDTMSVTSLLLARKIKIVSNKLKDFKKHYLMELSEFLASKGGCFSNDFKGKYPKFLRSISLKLEIPYQKSKAQEDESQISFEDLFPPSTK